LPANAATCRPLGPCDFVASAGRDGIRLISRLLTLPLAPLRGVLWVSERVNLLRD
jgi:hypothetical protein